MRYAYGLEYTIKTWEDIQKGLGFIGMVSLYSLGSIFYSFRITEVRLKTHAYFLRWAKQNLYEPKPSLLVRFSILSLWFYHPFKTFLITKYSLVFRKSRPRTQFLLFDPSQKFFFQSQRNVPRPSKKYYLETSSQNIHMSNNNPKMQRHMKDLSFGTSAENRGGHGEESISKLKMEKQTIIMHNNQKVRTMREEIIEPNIRYSKIGENRRTKLIDLVVNQGFKIRRASKMLKINESTAKSILKLYRQTGNVTAKTAPSTRPFSLKDHAAIATENQQKDGTLTTQNQEPPAAIHNSQIVPPQFYYFVGESCLPTFYMILPSSIL